MIPIFDNRAIVGYARNCKHAQRILKVLLQNVPSGWTIDVKERDVSIVDLPPGFIYSVHP